MRTISKDIQELSIKSLESTFNKLSNAYKSTSEKGSNTTLIKKRLDAVKIGLESLNETWNGTNFRYENDDLLRSIDVLQGIIPSIEKQLIKENGGSSQKTLNERRLTALKLAIESLEEHLI
ncbi:hypothetical protein [Exiguobacterium sp. s192]|uniref:hypothetical protein n=1 Tax=Exiguobacterium sp. s192 TaxID=2751206 RepID=UPI001BE7DE2F|nr:hypothetical protein [Exiguobacterium sp. s192]